MKRDGPLRVESIHAADGIVHIRCTGTVGIGSESISSLSPASDAVARWMREHPDHAVREIVVDFTEVDYRWGDAPVACFMPFVVKGIQHVKFVAGPASAPALEDLVGAVNMPWLSVEHADGGSRGVE